MISWEAVLTRGVRKTEIRFGIQTVQKYDIRADGFPTETARNPQFKSRVTKITFLATVTVY